VSVDVLRGLGQAEPSRRVAFMRIDGDAGATSEGSLAEEVPIAFVFNGRPHAVMLASPSDLEDFAVGFSLAEGIVMSAREVETIEVVRFAGGIELQITIPVESAERLGARSRRLAGRTGCGLCGVEQLSETLRLPAAPVTSPLQVTRTALWSAGSQLEGRQPVNHLTRAVHAAAWATPDGTLIEVREDVGRHNALDKIVGMLRRAGDDPAHGFAVVTSRASVEMVQKTAAAGIPLLAAVSRPTALAVSLADRAGVTLVGLLRGTSANVYTHLGRIADG
jgi:FdhD protein